MKLPNSWDEITVSQFFEIRKVDAKADNLDQSIELLAILSGKSIKEIEEVPLPEITKAIKQLTFIHTLPTKLIKRFWRKGRLYKVCYQANELSAGKYIDLCSYTKTAEDCINNAHKICALFIYPVKRWGWGKVDLKDDYNERAEAFLSLPISVVYPLAVFFCNLLTNLTPAMLTYLNQMMSKEMRKQLEHLRLKNIGGGTLHSTT